MEIASHGPDDCSRHASALMDKFLLETFCVYF